MSQWNQEVLLQQAVKENFERLDAEMEALLQEWDSVRKAYERVNGSASSNFDATQSGEWEVLQEASTGLLHALDGMLNNTYTRLPNRLTQLRGKVFGFSQAIAGARRRRRAMAAPAPIATETFVRRHMIGTGV